VVGAGVNEAVQKGLSKIKDTGLHQLASALVGGVAAKIVGGNASAGASVAASATKNNILSHKEAKEMEDELRKCKTDEERAAVLEKWGKISKDRDAVIKQWSIEFDNAKTDTEREAIFEKIRKQYEIWGISDLGEEFVLENRDTKSFFDSRYDGLSPERQKTLNDYYNAQTLTDKLLLGAKFLGQGWLEPITTYRNSQYQLMIENGIPENLAAVGADQMALEFAGPIVGVAIKTGDVVGSGLGNLQKVFSSEEVANAYQGIRIINKKYAGQVYQFEGELAVAYPNGVRFTKEGFPDLTPYAKLKLPVEGMTGTTSDFALANKAVGFSETPAGYTWHHVEDGQTMLLVPTTLHQAVRHTGGAALLRNGRIIAGYEI
jgi:hypothetical protein